MTEKIEISSDIPIPVPGGRRRYPWKKMKVGDSFFLPGNEQTQNTVSGAGRNIFGAGCVSTRKTTENGVVGYRVWRIK